MDTNKMRPESLMMTHGYKPELSEGAIKTPLFLTSTFAFKSAEEGKRFFELAYGLKERDQQEELGLIYSRINNPNLEILENRLCLWDKADDCTVFESGMSAISTVLLEFLKPGDLLLYSSPTYGGTDHFINHFLESIGVHSVAFWPWQTEEQILQLVHDSGHADRLSLVYVETPANPTNALIDIQLCRRVADSVAKGSHIPLAVDNTYMGPLWCHPLEHGADLVIYSATKYIGGHSDVIAGAVLGMAEYMVRVRTLRTFLGNMASPHTCWLLLRSLETLKMRMDQQGRNAREVADMLVTHPKIKQIQYLGHLSEADPSYEVYKRQYSSGGAMISIRLHGGEKEAFAFLNALQLIKLAVSLGSTESLVQHPDTMTHAGMCPIAKAQLGITSDLVRLSVGVEYAADLIADITQALEAVETVRSADPVV